MSHAMEPAIQREIRAIDGNMRCVDCGLPNPQWASVSYACLFCLECSGQHRGLGVHISFVRSITMDSWTEKQIKTMRAGGNQKLLDWFQSHQVPPGQRISVKYNTPAAELYRERLLATVEGRPLPTELPKRPPPSSTGGGYGGGSGSGGADKGSMERLPGETDAEYVTRQRALRGEASARMRDKFGGGTRMQGIGSDASYNAASGGYGGAGPTGASSLNVDEIGGQLGQIGQKSMRLLSDSFATLQTGVKETAQTLEERQIGQSLSNGVQNLTTKLRDPELSQKLSQSVAWGWSTFSTQAGTLWNKAAETVSGMGDGTEPQRLYNAGEGEVTSHTPMAGFGSDSGTRMEGAPAAQGSATALGSQASGGASAGATFSDWGGETSKGSGIDDLLGPDWKGQPPQPTTETTTRTMTASPPARSQSSQSSPDSRSSFGAPMPKRPSSVQTRESSIDAPAEEDDFFGSFGVK